MPKGGLSTEGSFYCILCVCNAIFCIFALAGPHCLADGALAAQPLLLSFTRSPSPIPDNMPQTQASTAVTTVSEGTQMDTDGELSLLHLQREIEDMKDSIEMAHENNIKTQTQVGGIALHSQKTDERLLKLEREVTSLRGYAQDLENYCIALDTIVRKHHLILNGVPEKQDESVNLAAFRVLQICFQEINLTDLDYCYRIGAPPGAAGTGKSKARPILVKLIREDHQRRVYRNRNLLRDTDEYASVFVNEDLPQIIMQRRADIRSIYLNAKDKGHEAKMAGTKVTIDNVTYHHKDIGALPQGLRLSDAKMVKVKGGLAFATANAYLSNFYRCDVRYNGILFDSSERAYQHERCKRLKAPEAAQQVLEARGPQDCKRISGYIDSNNEWDSQKREVMKSIVSAKFAQNEMLTNALLLTGNKNLIEATTDMFWGAAAVIGSKLLKNGTWKGRNELGTILTEVREDLKRVHNWVEMRAESSSSAGSPSPAGSGAIDTPLNAPPDTDQDLDLNRLSQSLNISVRRKNPKKKKGKGKNRNLNSQSGPVQPVPNTMGNHPVSTNQTGNIAHAPGSVSDVGASSFAAPTSHGWFPMPGAHLGFPAGPIPNIGIPPPGFQPQPQPSWPWPMPQSAYLPQISHTQTGMLYSQPMSSNVPANTSQSSLSYSSIVSKSGKAGNSVNASNYAFQKRQSMRSGNKNRSNQSHYEQTEVRRRSMPAASSSVYSDSQNHTVRIGTQAI